jgi:hypothetical protein
LANASSIPPGFVAARIGSGAAPLGGDVSIALPCEAESARRAGS